MTRVAWIACTALLLSCSFDESGLDPSDAGAAGAGDAGGGVDARVDARPPGIDAPDAAGGPSCDEVCPGICNGNVCEIDCSGPVDCSGEVVCPPGFDCAVSCGTDDCTGDIVCGEGVGRCTIDCGSGSCSGSIDCAAADCTIDCLGFESCEGAITCGPGQCEITCLSESCTDTVDCSASCGCDVYCLGRDTCTGGGDCPGECVSGNSGCTTLPPGCDVCSP